MIFFFFKKRTSTADSHKDLWVLPEGCCLVLFFFFFFLFFFFLGLLFKTNSWRWMLSAGTMEKQRVDNDIFKKLESSHDKICVQESSIKGWQGAIRTDTSNWQEYLREVKELEAEGSWQGCFSQMGQESRFTMRQKNCVPHLKCGELVFFPYCLQPAHNKKKMRYWRWGLN